MSASLRHLPLGQHVNIVHVNNGRQSVRTVYDSFLRQQLFQCVRDFPLRLCIQIRSGLVKQEYLRVFLEQGPRDQYPLAFAARQLAAQVADHRVVAVLHGRDLVVDLTLPGHLLDLRQGRVGVAVLQVEQHRVVEQDTVLRDHRDVLAEGCELQVLQVLLVQVNVPALRVVNPRQHVYEGRLPETTRAHDGIGGAWRNGQGQVVQEHG